MSALSLGLAALAAFFVFSLAPESDKALLHRAQNIFSPLKTVDILLDSAEAHDIALGRKLFFDSRLSKDGSVSCASCHQPTFYGTDPVSLSIGIGGKRTKRNTPSVLNLVHHQTFNWRGDRESIQDQVRRSFTDLEGLALSSPEEMLKKLRAAGYGAKISVEKAVQSLVAYQLSLVTTGSPFDRFLEGDISALSKVQKNGLRQFIHLGCVSCHAGPAIGAKDVIRFGLTRDYWEVTGSLSIDLGRMDITGNSNDRNAFKIPSLRNVAMTSPYFHDGSAKDLETAIRWMGELQLDRKLRDQEVQDLKSFLESFTGQPPESFRDSVGGM